MNVTLRRATRQLTPNPNEAKAPQSNPRGIGPGYNTWVNSADPFRERVLRRLGAFGYLLENERVRTEVMQVKALYTHGYYTEKELENYIQSLIRNARRPTARKQTPKRNRKYVAK